MKLGCVGLLPLEHGHDVVLAHNDDLFVFDLYLSPAAFAEQDPVAHFEIRGASLAVLEDFPSADRNDLAEGGLLAGCIGDHDSPGRLALFRLAPDDDPVVQWTDVHGTSYVIES